MPADVSSTTRTRPAFPIAYTRIFSSLGEWLGCAAVVAEVEADGVIVSAQANRVFRLADLAGLVREWMQAHSVEAVLASSDEALFAISTHETGP